MIVLGIIFWATWQSIENDQAQSWSYSTLVTQAKQGNVKSLEIKGSDGVATDKHGKRWNVHLPDDTASLATTLTDEGVEVTYDSGSGSAYWVQVLVPNLILLILIGGFMYFLIRNRSRR